jgi:hypothetical protein
MRFTPHPFVLTALLAALLAACGSPTTPPTLALTGVAPTVALPGANVVLQGTGFEAGQAVTFDGVEATVVDQTDTTITVVVPATFGYPTIAVAEASAERLLFVGSAYAGPTTLDGVQAALDALPEHAALRLPAGTYTGTSLDVDNRKLYGAGPTTLLQPSSGTGLYARADRVAVLADLAVEGGSVYVRRGRLSTALLEPVVDGAVVIHDVELDVIGIETFSADSLGLTIRDAVVTAGYLTTQSDQNVLLTIVDSAFTVTGNVDLDHYGALFVRDSSFDVVGYFDVYMDYILGMSFEGVTVTANGIDLYSYDAVGAMALTIRDSDFTSASYIYVGSDVAPIVVEDTTLTAVGYVEFDADSDGVAITLRRSTVTSSDYVEVYGGNYGATVIIEASSIAGPTYVDIEAEGGLAIVDSTVTSTGGYVDLDTYGEVLVQDSTLDAASYLYVYNDYGSVRVLDSDLAAATSYLEIGSYGPILVDGGSLTADTLLDLYSYYAGTITLRGTSSIVAGSVEIYDGGSSYAGNNGIVTLAANASIEVAGTMLINGAYSDLVVRDNGPIVAGVVDWNASFAHALLSGNERIESAANVLVFAGNAGGRLAATDNLFVAASGAGTITLHTLAGELTQSGNTFTGTASFPNNP